MPFGQNEYEKVRFFVVHLLIIRKFILDNKITKAGLKLLTKAIEFQTSEIEAAGLRHGYGLTDIVIKVSKMLIFHVLLLF